MNLGLDPSNPDSVGENSDPVILGSSGSTCSECFCLYHLVIVGIVGFILGGVICVGIFLYCQRQHTEQRDQERYNTLQRLHKEAEVKSINNDYISPTDLDLLRPITVDDSTYYSSNSLKRKDSYRSLTVKEATLKRDSMLRSNSMMRGDRTNSLMRGERTNSLMRGDRTNSMMRSDSFMRTNLSLNNGDY